MGKHNCGLHRIIQENNYWNEKKFNKQEYFPQRNGGGQNVDRIYRESLNEVQLVCHVWKKTMQTDINEFLRNTLRWI